VYAVLVMVGYQLPGGADVPLVADVWFEPSPGDWALAGEGGRAAALVDGVGSVRFDRLPWPELAERVGVTIVNLSILKTNKTRAVRFSTLEAICRELGCQPGDLLAYVPAEGPVSEAV
jgi:putative transcriptional regulator